MAKQKSLERRVIDYIVLGQIWEKITENDNEQDIIAASVEEVHEYAANETDDPDLKGIDREAEKALEDILVNTLGGLRREFMKQWKKAAKKAGRAPDFSKKGKRVGK